jgi:cell division septum initiation protein DivIVA
MAVPTDPAPPADRPSPAEVDSIATRTFATSFRGWDPDEVRVHLVKVAELVRSLTQRQADLERRLAEAEVAVRRADTSQLDPDEVAEVLGEETARVLRTARESAAEMRAKAEERVALVSGQAADDAARIRAEAEAERDASRRAAAEEAAATRAAGEAHVADLRAEAEAEISAMRAAVEEELAAARQSARDEAAQLAAATEDQAAEIRRDAEAEAAKTRTDADAYAAQVRTDADIYADRVKSEADAEVASRLAALEADIARERAELEHDVEERRSTVESELSAAKATADAQVAEAERVRERVLADLARKRKAARQHLEQLRAGRDRLLEAYEVVRATTESATRELGVVLPDAKRLADEAARRVAAEPEASVDDLEAELELARAADLPILLPDDGDAPDDGSLGDGDATDDERAVIDLVGDTDEPVEPSDSADDATAVATPESSEGTSGGATPESADESADEMSAGSQPTPAAVPTAGRDAAAPEGPVSPSGRAPSAPADAPAHDAPPTGKLHGRRSRRRGGDPLGGESLPEAPLEPVEVGADFEAVRVVAAPVEAEAPPAGEPVRPESPTDVPEAAAASAPDATTSAPTPVSPSTPVSPPKSSSAAEAALAAVGKRRVDEATTSGDGPTTGSVDDDESAEAPTVSQAGDPDVADIFERLRRDQDRPETTKPASRAMAAANDDDPGAAERGEAVPDPAEARLAELFERRDASVDEVGKRLAKRLKRLMSDEQSELLDELRRAKKRPSAETLLGEPAKFSGAVTDVARADLAGAVAAGVALAGDLDDRSGEHADVDLEATLTELVQSVAEPLRARLARALGEGTTDAADDEENPVPLDDLELADSIRSCYREWRGTRLMVAVTDACASAFGLGMRAALPAEVGLRWLTDRHDRPCSDCDDNRLAGIVARGERFPTGQLVPPAHPGCRCIALPPIDGLPEA